MKISCFLFGHKISEYTDSGSPFCENCKQHAYYDAKSNKDTFDTHYPFFEDAGILPRLADRAFSVWQFVQNKIYQFRHGKFNDNDDDLPF